MVKEVQPRAQKIAEHQRKYEQKHEERKIKERIQRVKKAGKNMRAQRKKPEDNQDLGMAPFQAAFLG